MQPNGRPVLADVDGRVPGRVQLMSVRLVDGLDDDPKQMCTFFEEGPEGNWQNPWRMAEGLKRGIENDWPEHHWAIVGNWRARYLNWRANMLDMGLSFTEQDVSPAEYIATFK